MIKKILVPVDFSETAANAARYAASFGERYGPCSIKVVHVFMPQVDSEYPNFIPPMTEFTKFRQKMLEDFTGDIKELRRLKGITLETELWIGFPADELVRHSGEYDLIIMGTTGEGGMLDKVFGSVSSTVAQRADCPVILVPSGGRYSRINRVLYANHYEAADRQMVEQVVTFNQLFHACIHFVHVKDGKSDLFELEREKLFSVLFKNGEPPFAFEIAALEGDSVADALNKYAEDHQTELIVLVTRQRKFWEQLFHRSQTRNLIRITQRPIMVLHLPGEL